MTHAPREICEVTCLAAAALPYRNDERATASLRGQLRLRAFADGVTPDWTTLIVEGPTRTVWATQRRLV